MNRTLLLKVLLFTIFVPGTFMLLIPYLIIEGQGEWAGLPLSPWRLPAYALFFLGAGVYLRCVWEFAQRGHGTPAPVDPPKHLVVTGLYRYNRNPMYVAITVALFALSWIFMSDEVLVYALCVMAAFHLFVVKYEEPTLRRLFGAEYDAYRAAVPRWGITLTPYCGGDTE
jgi:protein-S-isoprenylcysteine O-methyltransferase Ste14